MGRWTKEWERLYSRRTIIERMFRSMTRMRLLDKYQFFQYKKVEMHIGISTLTYLATMLGGVLDSDMDRIRRMRVM